MPQPPLLDLSALIVKDRDLLKPRMKITTYNQHDVGSFSSLGLFLANQSTRTCEPTSLCNQAQRRTCFPAPSTLPNQPSLRSSQVGLTDSISAIFLRRTQPLITFSLRIALFTYWNPLKYTNRWTRYSRVKPGSSSCLCCHVLLQILLVTPT